MSEREIIILDDAEALSVRAAEEIIHVSGEAICMHAQFTVCLTGGTTPAPAYSLMASRFHLSVDWKEVHFFWGDERCVPPDDPASNFGMANRTMLSKLALGPSQIHRMRGEDPPEAGAAAYEQELKNFFSLHDGELPRFDLVLLGVGDNAHIASLFPGSPLIQEKNKLVAVADVNAPQRFRLTLTAPVLNNAARVMFIVSGEKKAQAVKNVLQGPGDPSQFPAQLIDPKQGTVMWLLDKAAASLLSGSVSGYV
jgi:6-phosphogluconolactonase